MRLRLAVFFAAAAFAFVVPPVTGEVLSAQARQDLAARVFDSDDHRFVLRVMDAELDAVEVDQSPSGSFTDYFVPMMAKAIEAGASRGEVSQRLERLIDLAHDEKYFSGWVQGAMEEGGARAIRSYAWDWIVAASDE